MEPSSGQPEESELDQRYGKVMQPRILFPDEKAPKEDDADWTPGQGNVEESNEVNLNPGFWNITLDGAPPPLDESSTYIWAVNELGQLIIGIDDTRRYPEAFEPGAYEVAHIHRGHPSLTVEFDTDGKATVGGGRIAGSLFYRDGTWFIDDRSGRFSRERGGDLNPLLNEAKQLFEQNGIHPSVVHSD